jgi:hypothetical protein
VVALPQPVPQHNLWRAVRFAAALAITATGWCMAVRAPARTDSVSILSLTMAVLLAQVGFSKAVLPCFFCNVLGLMYYMAPNEILVFKIQAGYHLGGRAKPKCAAMDASSIPMAFASSICPPFRW